MISLQAGFRRIVIFVSALVCHHGTDVSNSPPDSELSQATSSEHPLSRETEGC